MQDMGGAPDPDLIQSQGGSVPALAVGQPYPPCSASLEDLNPMTFADLIMETHHRGKKLVVKRASPVVTLAIRSWCMVQDVEGKDTERLEMYLHKTKNGDELLELTKNFVVKEPYFTLSGEGEPTIRIDHPSDLVSFTDELSESSLAAEKAANLSKSKGNAALKDQELLEAHARYSEGLKITDKNDLEDMKRDIARNRAYVNLLLGQLDEVIVDARTSLINEDDARSKELDSKAYFRAGSAAYALGDFTRAKKFFEEQQKLTPDDKDGRMYLKRISVRLQEVEKGSHNFTKLRVNLSEARPRVDAATFISKTEVKTSKGKGRGLFATCPIAEGDLIMCEKAFCVVYGHERDALTAMTYDLRDDRIRVAPVGLTKALVQKLISNPSQISKVMDLYGDYQGDAKADSSSENDGVVDTFRIHDIMSRNAFGQGPQFSSEDAQSASTGLWIHAAYINHSCIPNATKEYIGDFMLLRAMRSIPKGEEIFHAYDESSDYDTRQASLMTTWGFECSCKLCEVESSDSKEVRGKREELRGEADAFLERENWAGASRVKVAKAQRIKKGIDETYDKEKYKGLPVRAGVGLAEWLSKASARR